MVFLRRIAIFFTLFLYVFSSLNAQQIIGTVTDKLSMKPIHGARMEVLGRSGPFTSDSLGRFTIPDVPPGRHALSCSVIGYQSYTSEMFIVSSVKVISLKIELAEQATQLSEVVILSSGNVNKPVNDLAFVSARSFTAEETERIPAALNDPGRLAFSYPGVKPGRDESENKLIVRGNSPFGVLWRLEGIDIPSPNHFAMPGSGGAGVTVFSSQLLSRSDFFTGGMPAEYGNTLSSAFDMHFREGNAQKKQYRFRLGLIGIDASAEGPFKNGRSSYLVNYRYSTLGLLSQAGFYLAGERTANSFQDLSFNLTFHSPNEKRITTVFGINGVSNEHHLPVSVPSARETGKGEQWEDRRKPASMGAWGLTHAVNINPKSSLRMVLAVIGSDIQRKYDTLNLANTRFRYNTEKYQDWRIAGTAAYQYRFSARTRLKTGAQLNAIRYGFFKAAAPRYGVTDAGQNGVVQQTSIDGSGNTQTAQLYAQVIHSPFQGFTVNAGFHFLYLFLNKTYSVEPRISFQYKWKKAHSLSLAYGKYSQLLPMSTYFYLKKDTINGRTTTERPNHSLSLPRSQHFILSYQFYLKNQWRLSAELYYQLLNKIPSGQLASSNYYMLNNSDGFPQIPAISAGTGRNAGIDIGIERFFFENYYLLATASLFESKYKTPGYDFRNTAFNDKFSTALNFGREFQFKNESVLQAGFRALYNGGFRYTPLDVSQSEQFNRYVPFQGADYQLQAPTYFRVDGRISYRTNRKKIASVLSLDIQNVTNRNNVTSMQYNTIKHTLTGKKDGVGLVPVISYQIEF